MLELLRLGAASIVRAGCEAWLDSLSRVRRKREPSENETHTDGGVLIFVSGGGEMVFGAGVGVWG